MSLLHQVLLLVVAYGFLTIIVFWLINNYYWI